MFGQVVETMLTTLVQNKNIWITRKVDNIIIPELFGLRTLAEPQELDFNIQALKAKCHVSYSKYLTNIKELLDTYAFLKVNEMFKMNYYDLAFLLWTQIFYNLVYRYDISTNDEERKNIINALKPLYFARSLSFNYNTWRYNVKYSEKEIRNQALGFTSQKYYLWGLYTRNKIL